MADDLNVEAPDPHDGITRRQALRRGALLGGALAWATPVVQVVGMQPAFAQAASPECKIEVRVILPVVGAVTLCLQGPPELCECINGCSTGACVAQCIEDFDPIVIVGPCP